jgi:hypothetical protein
MRLLAHPERSEDACLRLKHRASTAPQHCFYNQFGHFFAQKRFLNTPPP